MTTYYSQKKVYLNTLIIPTGNIVARALEYYLCFHKFYSTRNPIPYRSGPRWHAPIAGGRPCTKRPRGMPSSGEIEPATGAPTKTPPETTCDGAKGCRAGGGGYSFVACFSKLREGGGFSVVACFSNLRGGGYSFVA